jgi:hypothetical protein
VDSQVILLAAAGAGHVVSATNTSTETAVVADLSAEEVVICYSSTALSRLATLDRLVKTGSDVGVCDIASTRP